MDKTELLGRHGINEIVAVQSWPSTGAIVALPFFKSIYIDILQQGGVNGLKFEFSLLQWDWPDRSLDSLFGVDITIVYAAKYLKMKWP